MQAENNNTPTVTESPRKYMQWKDEDIALLLKDLEKPGNYEKWKENKSVYSKRVSSEVFDNNFNCETIKFKIRWLELRHQYWFDVLSNTNEHQAIFVRERMKKEFPHYETCDKLFRKERNAPQQQSVILELTDSTQPTTTTQPTETTTQPTETTTQPLQTTQPAQATTQPPQTTQPAQATTTTTTTSTAPPPTNEPAMFFIPPLTVKRTYHSRGPTTLKRLKPSIEPQNTASVATIPPPPPPLPVATNVDIPTEIRLKLMDIELEHKRMDHQERLQEMKLQQFKLEMDLQSKKIEHEERIQNSKLEQLKLEIELQKLMKE